jgi:hypothetical protein
MTLPEAMLNAYHSPRRKADIRSKRGQRFSWSCLPAILTAGLAVGADDDPGHCATWPLRDLASRFAP